MGGGGGVGLLTVNVTVWGRRGGGGGGGGGCRGGCRGEV